MIRNLDALEKEKRNNITLDEIVKIREQFSKVKNYGIPKLTEATGHQFSHPELFIFIFLSQEISSLFNRAASNHVIIGSEELLNRQEIRDMEIVKKYLDTLAHIGDASLQSGILFTIWPQDNNFIPSKAYLTDCRRKFVSNDALTTFWDNLELYDGKILQNPVSVNASTKGTYLEAVMGIIYLEGGFPAVEKAIHKLRLHVMKIDPVLGEISKSEYEQAKPDKRGSRKTLQNLIL